MSALVNIDIPSEAREMLSCFVPVTGFHTEGIVPEELSNHADIFLFQKWKTLIAAPNIPEEYVPYLTQNPVNRFSFGEKPVGESLDSLGLYNVASCRKLSIANMDKADSRVKEMISETKTIDVKQGMCRCGALILNDGSVISSDGGIIKQLEKDGVDCLQVSSEDIILPGYKSGCFGGCCGVKDNMVFIIGSLKHHPQGVEIRQKIKAAKMQPIELYDGPLFDAGSIFFV